MANFFKNLSSQLSLRNKINIDLGTSNTLISINNKIIFNEPTVIAYNNISQNIIAIGYEAKEILGRTPKNIIVKKPILEGVINDFDLTKQFILNLLTYKTKTSVLSSIISPQVLVGIPSSISPVEFNSLKDSIKEIGISNVNLFFEAVASAVGSNIDIFKKQPSMIIDIGGGTTDIAIISYGGIVENVSSKIAGDYIDEEIKKFFYDKHKIKIGDNTAENIKKSIPSLIDDYHSFSREKITISGKCLLTSLPTSIEVNMFQVQKIVQDSIKLMVQNIIEIIELASPEISSDLIKNGILLTGGGSLIKDLDVFIAKYFNFPIQKSKNPLNSVIDGLILISNDRRRYKNFFVTEDDLLNF